MELARDILLVFVAVLILMLGGWLVLIKSKHKFKLSKKRLVLICGLAILAVVLLSWLIGHRQRHTSDKAPTQSVKEKTVAAGSKSNDTNKVTYQIMYLDKNRTPAYVQVYTTAKTDDELIKLNDELLPKYKNLQTSVLIAYFDDPKIALSYFQRKDTPTKEQAKHYIAAMLYVKQIDEKIKTPSNLTRLSGGVKVLKEY